MLKDDINSLDIGRVYIYQFQIYKETYMPTYMHTHAYNLLFLKTSSQILSSQLAFSLSKCQLYIKRKQRLI